MAHPCDRRMTSEESVCLGRQRAGETVTANIQSIKASRVMVVRSSTDVEFLRYGLPMNGGSSILNCVLGCPQKSPCSGDLAKLDD